MLRDFNDLNVDSVAIHLDATQKATLNWELQIQEASLAIEKGYKVLWELDFGLFDRLLNPLSHPKQFLAFCLAIEHFRNVIWESFQHSTVAVLLYKGMFSVSEIASLAHEDAFQNWIRERFSSPEELYLKTDISIDQFEAIKLETFLEEPKAKFMLTIFCRDVALDFIKQLAGQLPFGVDPVIQLTLDQRLSPIEKLIYQNEEYFFPLVLDIKENNLHENYSLSSPGNQNLSVDKIANVGIYLPPVNKFSTHWNRLLDNAIKHYVENEISIRAISEESLITNLEGLDDLVLCPSAISYLGKRQLQGFCAAGGRVLTLEDVSLGLPNELLFNDK